MDFEKVERIFWRYIWIILAVVALDVAMFRFILPMMISMEHDVAPLLGFGLYAATVLGNLYVTIRYVVKPLFNYLNSDEVIK